jgi:hypothetical protein
MQKQINKMLNKTKNISDKTVAYAGAKIAIAGVFGYSLLVMLYTISRSSLTIYNIMLGDERRSILLANGFAIAYSVAIFSLLFALFSSIVGAVAGVILKKALQYFNPKFINRKAILISCIIAFAMPDTLYLLLYALLRNWITFNYMETFSFWFLFPAVIFFIACVIGGSELNRLLILDATALKYKR